MDGYGQYATPSHGGNTGSNPVGDANNINHLFDGLVVFRGLLANIWPINAPGLHWTQPCDTLVPAANWRLWAGA